MSGTAHKEGAPKFLLQLPKLFGECWLGEEEALSGARKGSLPSDHEKVAEHAKFHKAFLPVMGTHNNKLLFIPQGMRYSKGMKSKVSKDELTAFLAAMDSGARMTAGSPVHETMHKLSAEAQRITAKINGKFRTPEKLRRLMAELTGREIPEDFRLFPPFYTDCGKNLHIGKGVFFNAGCHFQDQGGVWVGDGTLIGHAVIICTLNHGFEEERRGDLIPSPVRIGARVWIGSGARILPGVTIGDGAIVAAGAVVTRDVAPRTIVAGVPARPIKTLDEALTKGQTP